MSGDARHDYHLVDPSPWPVVGSIGAFTMMVGAVFWMYGRDLPNHEQLAQRLGLARSSITNLVNLLELAPEVQDGVRLNQISEAHAKLLKGIKNKERQVAMFKQVVGMGLSVKATEASAAPAPNGTRSSTGSPAASLATSVRVTRSRIELPRTLSFMALRPSPSWW